MRSTQDLQTGIDVMTPTELTKQAFRLYDNLRIQSYKTPERSDHRKRLHSVGLRAFYRYKRRMRAEQNQDCMLEASRWGF